MFGPIDLQQFIRAQFFALESSHAAPKTAFEGKSDLSLETSDHKNLLIQVHIAFNVGALLSASEATTASKQPQRSYLTSDLKQ